MEHSTQTTEVQAAFAAGWRQAAAWANRSDLLADVDSPAYVRERDNAIAQIAGSRTSASLEQRAKAFAEHHHAAVNQKRKYTGEPYIVHPAAVVELVRGVPHTQEQLAAAWLHDTVEDTEVTIEEIEAKFGREVAALVEMLTDISRPGDGNRAVREDRRGRSVGPR